MHPIDETYLLISVTANQHLNVFAHVSHSNKKKNNTKKKEIIVVLVKTDQDFLPSQSGPISCKLTCALTPLRGRISEHGNTKSGKRKTLIDFTCFLMLLSQGPAVLSQLLALPPLPPEADTATVF